MRYHMGYVCVPIRQTGWTSSPVSSSRSSHGVRIHEHSIHGSSHYRACAITWGTYVFPYGKLAGQAHRFPAAGVAMVYVYMSTVYTDLHTIEHALSHGVRMCSHGNSPVSSSRSTHSGPGTPYTRTQLG